MGLRSRHKLIAGIAVASYGGKDPYWISPGEENTREFNQIEGDVIGRSGDSKYRKSYILSVRVTD
jgi:hypothetical protein